MRRRLLSETGLKATLIQHENTQAADAVFYDSATGTMVYYRLDDGKDLIPDTCTPIGVVVVPTSHNVYGDGSCGIMSLKEMSCSTPDTGTFAHQSVIWGDYLLDISSLDNMNVVCYVGSNGTVNETVQGTASSAYLPSDMFSTVANPYDTDTSYYYNDSDKYIPSPYNDDESRNSAYYQTSLPSSTANAMSDFDGIGNTQVITDLATAQSDWKTASTITNSYSSGYYPAACCCWRYSTDGTTQGQWYLPACGELGYIMPKLNAINTSVVILKNAYGYGIGIQLDKEQYYLSSSEYSSNGAGGVFAGTGYVSYNTKSANYGVRAFLRLGGKPKNYGDIYISGGSTSVIPASGGTSQISNYTYSQTWGWGDSTTDGGVITSGAEISVTSVSAESLGTTITNQTRVGDSKLTVSMNGKTATLTKEVYQLANRVTATTASGGVMTYGDVVAGTITNATVPASGGTGTATAGNGSQTWSKTATNTTYTYTSGSTKTEETEAASSGTYSIAPTPASTSASGDHLGTTIKAKTILGGHTVIWTGKDNVKTAEGYMYVYQEANEVTNKENQAISLTASTTTVTAGGGNVNFNSTVSTTYTYTSGTNSTTGEPHTVSLTSNSANATLSETTTSTGNALMFSVFFPENTDTLIKSAIVQAKGSDTGVTKTVTITQEAKSSGYIILYNEGGSMVYLIFSTNVYTSLPSRPTAYYLSGYQEATYDKSDITTIEGNSLASLVGHKVYIYTSSSYNDTFPMNTSFTVTDLDQYVTILGI